MKTLLLGAFAFTAAVAMPGVSVAATYAYVNQAGDVMTVTADTAAQALIAAPGIDENSGVLLVDEPADQQVLDEEVSGV